MVSLFIHPYFNFIIAFSQVPTNSVTHFSVLKCNDHKLLCDNNKSMFFGTVFLLFSNSRTIGNFAFSCIFAAKSKKNVADVFYTYLRA